MTSFNGHKLVWQWEYSQQAEKSAAAAAQTARTLAGADILLVKAMDGPYWQYLFDPLSPDNLAQFTQQADSAAPSTVIPWCVPVGPMDADLHSTLQAYGDGTLVLDVEPYRGFWKGGDFNAYLDRLIGYGPARDDYQCWVSIDPRPSAWDALNVDSWADRVAGLMPQLYWPDFGENPWNCVTYLQRCINALNPQRVVPVFSAVSDPADLTAFWDVAAEYTCIAPALWRLGSATAEQLQAFGALTI